MRVIEKVARKLAIKYAAELFDPNASAAELTQLIRNNLAGLYKSFMSSMQDGNGLIHQILMKGKGLSLKAPADAPDKLNIEKYIKKLALVYTKFVADIDNKEIIEINDHLLKFIKMVEKIRSEVRDEIKLNKYLSFDERNTFASEAERVLKGFEDSLLRQAEYIGAGARDVVIPTVEHEMFDQFKLPGGELTTRRRPKDQKVKKIERLMLTYGPLYGINSDSDKGKIAHSDALLFKDLISALMGLDNLTDKSEASLRSHVKSDLKKRIQEVLSPKLPNLPFGPLPKKPPGK